VRFSAHTNRLIISPDRRLNVDQIKKHPFFYGVDWPTIRTIEAPFIPRLKSITDTSYFPTEELEQIPDEPADTDITGAHKELAFLGCAQFVKMLVSFLFILCVCVCATDTLLSGSQSPPMLSDLSLSFSLSIRLFGFSFSLYCLSTHGRSRTTFHSWKLVFSLKIIFAPAITTDRSVQKHKDTKDIYLLSPRHVCFSC
jgi:hypothetical protein